MPDADPAGSTVNLADVPAPLVDQLAAAVTRVVSTIPGHELVAVDLVYYAMEPGDTEPDPIDVFGCSRPRRDEILAEQPPPAGLVYVWSNLEYDAYASAEDTDRLLGPAWMAANDFAQALYEQVDIEDDMFDFTWAARSVLIAVCRCLNEGGWTPARPPNLATDAVIFPAARGGVDPDTAYNVNAALTGHQRARLDAAGLLLPA